MACCPIRAGHGPIRVGVRVPPVPATHAARACRRASIGRSVGRPCACNTGDRAGGGAPALARRRPGPVDERGRPAGAADRSHCHTHGASRWNHGGRSRRSRGSFRLAWPRTRTAATTWSRTSPVGCHRTCTSATSPPHAVCRSRAAARGLARRPHASADGAREGWWGVSGPAEAFLDQLVTWRELGFNMCVHRPSDYDRYESLPAWARATLGGARRRRAGARVHARGVRASADARPAVECRPGSARRARGASTTTCGCCGARRSWNGPPRPRTRSQVMIELNNKYALDGRDPNSYSGIFWTLGRYDRPWAPSGPCSGRCGT